MDTRATPEQAELRRSARQLAGRLGPSTVADLDEMARSARLADAVRAAGWLELRDDAGESAPLGGSVEAAIVAEALGELAADVAFTGPLLARDIGRRAGVEVPAGAVLAFSPTLDSVAVVEGGTSSIALSALDAGVGDVVALALVPEGSGFRLAAVRPGAAPEGSGADLTRRVVALPAGAAVEPLAGSGRALATADVAAVTALGLALTSADLVGVMRGVLGVTVAYAADRRQFGVPVGSFQAVQHLLAEAHCLLEGSISVARHASWAADALDPAEAVAAARVAKAYCARAAKTVCETAIQVHGGIGNTWECVAHVYLRRALLSSQWFGDDAVQLRELADERLGTA